MSGQPQGQRGWGGAWSWWLAACTAHSLHPYCCPLGARHHAALLQTLRVAEARATGSCGSGYDSFVTKEERCPGFRKTKQNKIGKGSNWPCVGHRSGWRRGAVNGPVGQVTLCGRVAGGSQRWVDRGNSLIRQEVTSVIQLVL